MKSLASFSAISIILASLLFIASLIVFPVIAGNPGPQVKISILKYSPTPAEQGSVVDVWLQLSAPSVPVDDVVLRLGEEFPFSVPSGQIKDISIGRISGGESKVVKVSLLVDSDAPNGDRPATFYYNYLGASEWLKVELPLSLQSQNSLLVVDSFSTVPSSVIPGQSFDLFIVLKNNGRVDLKSVDVSLDLSGSKFSVLGSGGKKRVDRVSVDGSESVSFRLVAGVDAVVKVHDIPVVLSYLDDKNRKFSDSLKASVVINAPSDISVLVDDTSFFELSVPAQVSLKIVNKGIGDLKYVSAELLESPDYEFLGLSDIVYVGNLESDDFETVQFSIRLLVDNPSLLVKISFKDSYNVDGSVKQALNLRKIDAPSNGSSSYLLWTVIILIVAIVWYWRFFRIRKQL